MADSGPPRPNRRNSTAPSEPAIKTMQMATKMALRRPIRISTPTSVRLAANHGDSPYHVPSPDLYVRSAAKQARRRKIFAAEDRIRPRRLTLRCRRPHMRAARGDDVMIKLQVSGM